MTDEPMDSAGPVSPDAAHFGPVMDWAETSAQFHDEQLRRGAGRFPSPPQYQDTAFPQYREPAVSTTGTSVTSRGSIWIDMQSVEVPDGLGDLDAQSAWETMGGEDYPARN